MKEECVKQNFASFDEAAPPLLTASSGTTLNGPIGLSAIGARDNFARYNLNSWLDNRGSITGR
jgi:hypothetical protein